MPSYKITYFPFRGVAEAARQILAYAGQDFEDVRVEMANWPAIKNEMPFGQLPVLEVDGKKIPQSAAMCRYLAKQFGLNGSNDFEAAWVDAIVDQYKDYYNEFSKFYYIFLGFREGDKEALRKEFGEPARDKFYGLLSTILKKNADENSSGFLVGKSVTFVDFLIAEHVATLQELIPEFLSAFPEVIAHSALVREIPQIKSWIDRRPKSQF